MFGRRGDERGSLWVPYQSERFAGNTETAFYLGANSDIFNEFSQGIEEKPIQLMIPVPADSFT